MRPTGAIRGRRRGRARRHLAVWVAGALLLAPSLARADAAVRLDYRRGPRAAGCPDAGAFRARVVRRLGRDPFSPSAGRRLEIRVDAGGPGRVATLTLVGAHGRVVGVRRLAAPRCRDLVPAVALAVTIALEAPVAPPPRPAPPPGPAPRGPEADPQAPPAPFTATPPPVPPAVPPLGLEAFFALAGDTGLLPTPAPGLVVGAGLDRGTFAASLALSTDLPAIGSVSGGAVSGWDLQAVARGCGLLGALGACAVARGGVVRLAGLGLVRARAGFVPTASLGLGARFDRRLGPGMDLRVSADVDLAVVRAVARDSGTGAALWRAPPVFLTLGVGLALWP